MRTYFDCVQCFVRQALDAARLLTGDENIHERVLRGVLSQSSDIDFYKSPPEKGQRIHRLIRDLLGDDDPYREIKHRSNQLAMDLYPELKKNIGRSSDPFETAVRYAIAGNIIDLGVNSDLDESKVYATLEDSIKHNLPPDAMDVFRNTIDRATDILYLGDNAGEIVFDRLLIEELPSDKITFAVRGRPVINDATLEDAQFVGLTDIVEVIDNGSDAPGTILDDCSPAFRDRFAKADFIIAKGQGNYESLSDIKADITFLLMAKCPVIARDIGCETGSFIIRNSFRKTTEPEREEIGRI